MSSKGTTTRERILDHAFRLAGRHGVEGVTLGVLAADLGLSKSGLFAHFASKEALSVAVLETTAERFAAQVLRPAMKEPRGEPRLRRIFENWLAWLQDPALPGGCPMVAASVELDDKPGVPRDVLVAKQKQLRATIAKAVSLAVEEGHLRRDLDPELVAYELLGILYACHHSQRLLEEPRSLEYARRAFDRLLDSSRPPSD